MNLIQALGTLSELPDGVAVTISATNRGYMVALYVEDGMTLQQIDYGMSDQPIVGDMHDLIVRLVAARDTALLKADPGSS